MAPAADTDRPSAPRAVGVVDVGSNAIRIEIARIDDAGATHVVESQRATVSLGRDVFLTGAISDATLDAAIEVLAGFRAACDRHGVSGITAIATAAMREAENRPEAVARIRSETGIGVSVVSGDEEARLLVRAARTRLDLDEGQSLLVDLGGGSVEVGLVDAGEVVFVQSYPAGSLRLLATLRDAGEATYGRVFVDRLDAYVQPIIERIAERFGARDIARCIATGGNIESIADILRESGELVRHDGIDACRVQDIETLARTLADKTYRERMDEFGLQEDRADTIVPAATVYARIGRTAGVDRVLVPRVGLREGLVEEALDVLRASDAAERANTDGPG